MASYNWDSPYYCCPWWLLSGRVRLGKLLLAFTSNYSWFLASWDLWPYFSVSELWELCDSLLTSLTWFGLVQVNCCWASPAVILASRPCRTHDRIFLSHASGSHATTTPSTSGKVILALVGIDIPGSGFPRIHNHVFAVSNCGSHTTSLSYSLILLDSKQKLYAWQWMHLGTCRIRFPKGSPYTNS
jgi:hypothetical protein